MEMTVISIFILFHSVREAFGFLQHAAANAAALKSRTHGEHAEIACIALFLDVAAREQFVFAFGE